MVLPSAQYGFATPALLIRKSMRLSKNSAARRIVLRIASMSRRLQTAQPT